MFWRFLREALDRLVPGAEEVVRIADVGASMAFDALYLLRMLTENFEQPMPFKQTELSLVEGDAELIARREQLLRATLSPAGVGFRYFRKPLVQALPLDDASQHVVLCSEVVEHLERPAHLFGEMFRILKPGGFLLLTIDNSPKLLQHIRRIPVWLAGRYAQAYARPAPASEISAIMQYEGRE